MRIYNVVLIALVSFLFVRCEKDPEVQLELYNFSTEVEVNYTSDTISIGDTLWFESQIQGFLKDSASQKTIHFREANINLNMVIRSWNSANQINQSELYEFVSHTPIDYVTNTKDATLLGLYYLANESVFTIKTGVIFSQAGVFSIDTDHIIMKNYFTNETEYLGGGIIEMNDINNEYKAGVLKAEIIAENRNLNLYQGLPDGDKQIFQPVTNENSNKYFFIKVNE